MTANPTLLQRCWQSGPFWMLLAGLFFAVMGVFVKLGARHFSTAELVFYRCIIGFLVIFAVVGVRGQSLRTPVLGLQLSRGISGTVALMLYFYAIAHLPLATAVTLNYTSPLFLALFTAFWLKERVAPRLFAAIGVGFIGVALLLRPTLAAEQWLAGLLGLASGVLAGVAYLNVRRLGQAGEPEWRTVFYFSLIASLAAAGWMLTQPFSPITTGNIGLILGMGGCATAAQLAMTRAYRKGQSLVVASLAYVTVVFSSLFGYWIWDDQLPLPAIAGIVLIIGSGLLTSLNRRR